MQQRYCISALGDLRGPLGPGQGSGKLSLLYQGSCIDPIHQCHTLDPASKAPEARRPPTFRLLIVDYAAGNDFYASLDESVLQGMLL